MHLRLEPLLPSEAPPSEIAFAILAGAPNAAAVPGVIKGVIEGQLSLYRRTGAAEPWIGYLARDEQTGNLVGSCSFIGKPADGSVEIAYFTFPPYERQGVASGMAGKLLEIAAGNGNPNLHAFTLPEQNSSTAILLKSGFVHAGEDHDVDAGRVWRWERNST